MHESTRGRYLIKEPNGLWRELGVILAFYLKVFFVSSLLATIPLLGYSALKKHQIAFWSFVSNPFVLLAIILTLFAYSLIMYKQIWLNRIEQTLKSTPTEDRLVVLRVRFKIEPSSNLSVDKWISEKRRLYIYISFVILCLLSATLSIVAITKTKKAVPANSEDPQVINSALAGARPGVSATFFEAIIVNVIAIEASGDPKTYQVTAGVSYHSNTIGITAAKVGYTFLTDDRRYRISVVEIKPTIAKFSVEELE